MSFNYEKLNESFIAKLQKREKNNFVLLKSRGSLEALLPYQFILTAYTYCSTTERGKERVREMKLNGWKKKHKQFFFHLIQY